MTGTPKQEAVRVSRAGGALYLLVPEARKAWPPERILKFATFDDFLHGMADEHPDWFDTFMSKPTSSASPLSRPERLMNSLRAA